MGTVQVMALNPDRREQKIELDINTQMSLMNYKSNYWRSLREFAKRERIFMPNDEKYISLIENASITRQPTRSPIRSTE